MIWIASLVLLVVASSLALSLWMKQKAKPQRLQSLQDLPSQSHLILLGCPPRTRDGRKNIFYTNRIATTAAAYHHLVGRKDRPSNPSTLIVCSGWDQNHEASEMKDDLQEAGVPAHAIRVDGEAQRTVNSILNCRADSKLDPGSPLVFISQAFHLPRVLFLSRHQGLGGLGLPARGRMTGWRWRLRESAAQFRAVLDVLFQVSDVSR